MNLNLQGMTLDEVIEKVLDFRNNKPYTCKQPNKNSYETPHDANKKPETYISKKHYDFVMSKENKLRVFRKKLSALQTTISSYRKLNQKEITVSNDGDCITISKHEKDNILISVINGDHFFKGIGIPKSLALDVIERVIPSPANLIDVVQNELAQKDHYEAQLKEALASIDVRYDTSVTFLREQGCDSKKVIVQLNASREKEKKAKQKEHQLYFTKEELEQVAYELRELELPGKVEVTVDIGYDPLNHELIRMGELAGSYGNGVKMPRLGKKKFRTNLVNMLKSIVTHDPNEDVKVEAQKLIDKYDPNNGRLSVYEGQAPEGALSETLEGGMCLVEE